MLCRCAVYRGLSDVAAAGGGSGGAVTAELDWASNPAVLGMLDECEEVVRHREALRNEKERLVDMRKILTEF